MLDRYNTRQNGLAWFQETHKYPMLVGGAGGIGSWFSLFAARANFHISVIDYDVVEEGNISGQFFKTYQTKSKVEELASNIEEFCDTQITTFIKTVTTDVFSGYNSNFNFVSCFDNMVSRKEAFNAWLENRVDNDYSKQVFFVDGRLTVDSFQIFFVKNNEEDIEAYKKSLFNDKEVDEPICSLKQTTHMAAMIASNMISLITNHIYNISNQVQITDVPFYTEFNQQLMLYKTKTNENTIN